MPPWIIPSNPFFPENQQKKFFTEVIGQWITRRNATARLFGITSTAYSSMTANQRDDARKAAFKQMEKRFESIIQRRHDCIHNCDRPRNAPQPIGRLGTVRNVIRDVRFLVTQCDQHIDVEFLLFLDRIGCSGVTRNALRV